MMIDSCRGSFDSNRRYSIESEPNAAAAAAAAEFERPSESTSNYGGGGGCSLSPNSHAVVGRTDGWGRLALKAVVEDNPRALRTALERTTSTHEETMACLACKAKGGNSWYYSDFRVRAGYDPDLVTPEPGDTILHIALRHRRSTTLVATLLELGADRLAANNSGETPVDIDPLAIHRADELLQELEETAETSSSSSPPGSSKTARGRERSRAAPSERGRRLEFVRNGAADKAIPVYRLRSSLRRVGSPEEEEEEEEEEARPRPRNA